MKHSMHQVTFQAPGEELRQVRTGQTTWQKWVSLICWVLWGTANLFVIFWVQKGKNNMTVYDAYFTGKESLIHFQKECGYFILCISYFLLSIWVPFPARKSMINTVGYPNQIRLTYPKIAEFLDGACNPPSPDAVVISALFLALFHGLFHGLMEERVG